MPVSEGSIQRVTTFGIWQDLPAPSKVVLDRISHLIAGHTIIALALPVFDIESQELLQTINIGGEIRFPAQIADIYDSPELPREYPHLSNISWDSRSHQCRTFSAPQSGHAD